MPTAAAGVNQRRGVPRARAPAIIGSTVEQDPKYALRLVVDIGIKALSPAINDPTTAVQALDQIGDLLQWLGKRDLDVGRVLDAGGQVRVSIPIPS